MIQSCSNCIYYQVAVPSDHMDGPQRVVFWKESRCRRFPPTAISVLPGYSGDPFNSWTAWPSPRPDDLCGEHYPLPVTLKDPADEGDVS